MENCNCRYQEPDSDSNGCLMWFIIIVILLQTCSIESKVSEMYKGFKQTQQVKIDSLKALPDVWITPIK